MIKTWISPSPHSLPVFCFSSFAVRPSLPSPPRAEPIPPRHRCFDDAAQPAETALTNPLPTTTIPLACKQEGGQLCRASAKERHSSRGQDDINPNTQPLFEWKKHQTSVFESPQQRIYPASRNRPKNQGSLKFAGPILGSADNPWDDLQNWRATTGIHRFPTIVSVLLSSRSGRGRKKAFSWYICDYRFMGPQTYSIATKSRPEAPHGGCRQQCPAIPEVVVVMAVSKQTQQRQRRPRARRDRSTSRTKLLLGDQHPDGRVDAQ
jgi:hypothetical protein